jgi:hypothetical protein
MVSRTSHHPLLEDLVIYMNALPENDYFGLYFDVPWLLWLYLLFRPVRNLLTV